ncbi:MAG: transposase [Methanobacterium sp.]
MKELKNRRLIRNGDTLIFDKGYYSYDNYVNGILHHKIVPIIFAKKYFKIERVLKELNYPLSSFKGSKIKKNIKVLYTKIVKELKSKIWHWKRLKGVRSLIEEWNKLTKKSLNMSKIHSYTRSSFVKYVAVNALLAALIILQGYNSKEAIQTLSE